ncbi:triose-phosphate isomerase [Candidatus Endowatersipora endosymbiont of Watersipora subatra]|uniref:triose-phosphate isomerase n=1 Tax=Candidatus Endowatersipora endosymbiont of Watersipora subatra TaxID=3077946 RepID=UPI00312C7581
MTPDLKPLIVGNWKMNGDRDQLDQLAILAHRISHEFQQSVDVVVCPPATLLYVAKTISEGSPLMVGAQDCHNEATGAHTGDISAEMIADCLAEFCIVGHSERRNNHRETNSHVAGKVKACWRAGLASIVCIGETKAQYDACEVDMIITKQITDSIPEGATEKDTIIAYEPFWAIGSTKIPSLKSLKEIHALIRDILVRRFGDHGLRIRILYGGSVRPENATELLSIQNVNGALVGGASLQTADFLAICQSCQSLVRNHY